MAEEDKVEIEKPTIKFKAYTIIGNAISEGIQGGFNKAAKYNEKLANLTPQEEAALIEHLENYIGIALDNVIDFD